MNPDLSKLPLCDQDWNAMERLGDGRRFCTRCSNPVADFRGMTKHEITLVLATSDERVCGVYSPEHLRPVEAPEPRRCRSPLVTLALGASLLAARAEAQAPQPPAHEQAQLPADGQRRENAESAPSPSRQAATADTFVIRGTVRDETGPLVAAMVIAAVDGRRVGATTDTSGGYVLRVPEPGRAAMVVRVARIGYETKQTEVRPRDGETTVDFTLQTSALGLMALVVTPDAQRAMELKREVGYSVTRILGSP